MKKLSLYLGIMLFAGYLQAKSVSEVQSISGDQRNQIISTGSGSTFDTTLSYTWTGDSNTWNSIGYFNNHVVLGTNGLTLSPTTPLYVYPISGQTRSYIDVESLGGGNVGLFINQNNGATSGPYGYFEIAGTTVYLEGNGTGFTDMQFQAGGSTELKLTSAGGSTFGTWNLFGANNQIGTNSASVLTIAGKNITAPNGLLVNANVQWIPPDNTGTITNGANTQVIGSVSTYDATLNTKYLPTSGSTNQIFGDGVLPGQWRVPFATFTLNINGTAFNNNACSNTNGLLQPLRATFDVIQPAGAITAFVRVSANGTVTNIFGFRPNTGSVTTTNSIMGMVNPGWTFGTTNITGATTLLSGLLDAQ